ncbi:hypothetical protein O4J56_15695 [Nocardiopsis sp. RSe5-2]|uniref:DUF4129 domain-containing protein n=1 Tax=Nocardiopsis endophytica TaxID=3018445 RepID=A0ABT4U559_9ACTN|nr:hypothetical protein [Nocardiopsis endophytica]MDA2812087.1 hypothetical protein [Nocardiopsis endophytica]
MTSTHEAADEGAHDVRDRPAPEPAPEPAGNRYRLAESAKRLARTSGDAEAALDAFEDALPDPPVKRAEPAALLSPPPTPFPGFPSTVEAEDEREGTDGTPRRRRFGAVLPLSALLLGALLLVAGAELVEATIEAAGGANGGAGGEAVDPRPVLAPLPGLLLLVCLLGAGEHIAVGRPRPRRGTEGASAGRSSPPRGRTRWGPPLLYGAVLASACALAALWGHAAAPSGPLAIGTAVGAALLTALAGATCLAAQRRSAAAARDGDGRVAPFVDASSLLARVRTRRSRSGLHRLRDRARTAVHTHVRAWEDVHHECLRLIDARSESGPAVAAALNELGAVAPPGSRTPLPGGAVDFAGLGGGNTAATVRCLARYHPRDLEERFDDLRGRTPAPVRVAPERRAEEQ